MQNNANGKCKKTRTRTKKNEGKKLRTQKRGRNDANGKNMKTKVKHINAICKKHEGETQECKKHAS